MCVKKFKVVTLGCKVNSYESEAVSNMFENIAGQFDIIISNPPYIETNTIPTLDLEVQNEPHLALDGGSDGLDFYRIIANQAPDYLNEDGILIIGSCLSTLIIW